MKRHHNHATERWRFFRPKYKQYCKPLNTLPMLDLCVIFFLFLIAGANFMIRPGVIVELPAGAFLSGSHYGRMVVTMTQEGMIFFNDERTPLEGLELAFDRAARKNGNIELTIEADARVPYGSVIKVMNMATAAGIREINLATSPEPWPGDL